jgi:hypothetical protein
MRMHAGSIRRSLRDPGTIHVVANPRARERTSHQSRARHPRAVGTHRREFEEQEDEGAFYAFEHDAASVVFIVDQEFYGDDDFPNSDFSMLDDRDPRSPETPVDIWL